MRASYVQFEGQSKDGCSCMMMFFPLPEQKIAYIKENMMISDMQLRS